MKMDLTRAVNLVSDAFGKIAKVVNGADSDEQAAEAFHIVWEQNPDLVQWLRWMLAAPAVPQARPTCATCEHWRTERFFACAAGVSTDHNCKPPATFGCSLHEPIVARPDRAEASQEEEKP